MRKNKKVVYRSMPYLTEDNIKLVTILYFTSTILFPHVVHSGIIHFERPCYPTAGLGRLAAGGVHAVYLLEVALEAAEL